MEDNCILINKHILRVAGADPYVLPVMLYLLLRADSSGAIRDFSSEDITKRTGVSLDETNRVLSDLHARGFLDYDDARGHAIVKNYSKFCRLG